MPVRQQPPAAGHAGACCESEEYYPSLYQNLITRRLAAHPEHDRFSSRDLREAFDRVGFTLQYAFELKRMGILGVGVKKTDGPTSSQASF